MRLGLGFGFGAEGAESHEPESQVPVSQRAIQVAFLCKRAADLSMGAEKSSTGASPFWMGAADLPMGVEVSAMGAGKLPMGAHASRKGAGISALGAPPSRKPPGKSKKPPPPWRDSPPPWPMGAHRGRGSAAPAPSLPATRHREAWPASPDTGLRIACPERLRSAGRPGFPAAPPPAFGIWKIALAAFIAGIPA